MVAIDFQHAKECMSHLLLSDTFDSFSFIEGEIVTSNTFTIDGYLQKKFYESSEKPLELPEYSLWRDIREFCFSVIRGKRTPLSFRFIFSLSPANIEKLLQQTELPFSPSDIQGLYLNIKYNGERLQCITGTSMKTFTLDKSLDQAWDGMVKKFFVQHNISFEEKV